MRLQNINRATPRIAVRLAVPSLPLVASEGDVLALGGPDDDLSASVDGVLTPWTPKVKGSLADDLTINDVVLDGLSVLSPDPVAGLLDGTDLASLGIGVCVEDAPVMLFGSELDGS
jgi:hypothetical protein